MTKYIVLLMTIALTGCQSQLLKPPVVEVESICRISNAELMKVQSIEKRFLNTPGKRGSLLQNAINAKNQPLIVLLMSTPYASTEQLQESKRLYSKLRLNLNQECPGDQYLHLRNQYTSALLWLRAEQDKLITTNKALQEKIDALTQIESDLNLQREAK